MESNVSIKQLINDKQNQINKLQDEINELKFKTNCNAEEGKWYINKREDEIYNIDGILEDAIFTTLISLDNEEPVYINTNEWRSTIYLEYEELKEIEFKEVLLRVTNHNTKFLNSLMEDK